MKPEAGQLTVNDLIAIGKAASFLRFEAAYKTHATDEARKEWRSVADALTDIECRCQPQPTDPHIALMEAEHEDRMPQPAEDPDEWVIQDQWPKYYTTLDSPNSDVAFVKRVDETSYSVVYKNGRECSGFLWVAKNQSRRKQLTEAEAMALLNPTSNAYFSYHEKHKTQPQKTMLRLWIDSDCNIHAGLKGDRDLELFYDHETRQFYTEEPS